MKKFKKASVAFVIAMGLVVAVYSLESNRQGKAEIAANDTGESNQAPAVAEGVSNLTTPSKTADSERGGGNDEAGVKMPQQSDSVAELVRQIELEDVTKRDVLIDKCGTHDHSPTLNVDTQLAILEDSAQAGRFPSNDQLNALEALEELCQRWHRQITTDDGLRLSAEEQAQALKSAMSEIYDTARTFPPKRDNILSEEHRRVALDFVANNEFVKSTTTAANYLINFDTITQRALGKRIGTADATYIRWMSDSVVTIVRCRLEGNCGKTGMTALERCVTNLAYCDGVYSGVRNRLSVGQYEDVMILSDAVMGFIVSGNWPNSLETEDL